MKVLIFSDKASYFPELAAGAKSLGGESVAYTVDTADAASKIPADKVYYTTPRNGKMVEDFYPTFKALVNQENPDVILIGATRRGKYMAGRLAASLGTAALTDLSDMAVDGSGVTGTQLYYGGAAVRTLASRGKAAVVTVGAGAYEACTGSGGEAVEFAFVPADSGIILKETKKKEGEPVNLAAAKKVIGVGRGFATQESLCLAEALAEAVGGEVGCSRPIAEGEGWMSTDRYIGVSGVMLKPDVYFAVGISGQVQHTIGISGAKLIVAVNKDKNAPIFKICDYGIVGDLNKIVPELSKLLKG